MDHLFREFSPVKKKDWLAKVEKDLKGKSIDAFNWQPIEGITLTPFAHADDLKKKPLPLRGKQLSNQWEIGVIVQSDQIKLANQEALKALENGATAICFELKKNPNKETLKTLLKDIQLEWISVHFQFKQSAWKRFVGYFIDYTIAQGYDANKLACSFSIKGAIVKNSKDAALITKYTKALPKARFITINAINKYNNTADTIKELAYLLKSANTQLEQLAELDLNLEAYQSNFQFSITLSNNYFINIAKIRALKILWKQVLQAWNANLTGKAIIEVHLTRLTQTKEEHYNKISATAQALAAVVAGVKRLYIHPTDAFKNEVGTPFEQRIAMNIQHLLQLESYMDRVIDPSAGSYYIENLTDKIAAAAWEAFRN